MINEQFSYLNVISFMLFLTYLQLLLTISVAGYTEFP